MDVVRMVQKIVSMNVFVVGLVVAILVSSGVSAVVATRWARGPQGPQGSQGPQGDQGIQGVTGPTGPVGAPGATGAEGARGERGDTGATGAAGLQGLQGPAGSATRTVIEGFFNVTQVGDLVYYVNQTVGGYPSVSEEHWKRIDVPQITLADMPSVEIYVKTTFVSIENVTTPVDMWKWYGPVTGGGVHVMYNEGCVYLQYKNYEEYFDTFAQQWKQSTSYRFDGNYKIVVVK